MLKLLTYERTNLVTFLPQNIPYGANHGRVKNMASNLLKLKYNNFEAMFFT
jgi:hypothetical protein